MHIIDNGAKIVTSIRFLLHFIVKSGAAVVLYFNIQGVPELNVKSKRFLRIKTFC